MTLVVWSFYWYTRRFASHNDRTTTWEDPRIAIIKQQRQNQLASLQQHSQSLVSSSGITQNLPAEVRCLKVNVLCARYIRQQELLQNIFVCILCTDREICKAYLMDGNKQLQRRVRCTTSTIKQGPQAGLIPDFSRVSKLVGCCQSCANNVMVLRTSPAWSWLIC